MARRLTILLLAATTAVAAPAAQQAEHSGQEHEHASMARTAAIKAALAHPGRSEVNKARDQYRHPVETLDFFEVDANDTVVELWPGGGWYTEVLAPYLSAAGALHVIPPAGRYDERIREKIAGNPAYRTVQVATFNAGQPTGIASGSADVVLTFRNVHSWLDGESPIAGQVFAEAFRMLKPGGTLGVVEHRLPETAADALEKSSGYVKVSTVRRLAEAAGFHFVGGSEINANPKDSKDYPDGVWTLPPSFRLGDKDRAKYAAIGESDRMTLKFAKPR